MRALSLVALVVAAGLAGCTQEPAGDGPEPRDQPPVPVGYTIACPPGGTPNDAGVCRTRIVSTTESQQEPYAALHPTDPDVMVVGVNAGHTAGGIVVDPTGPSFDAVRLDLWFSQDGGGTWQRSTLPPIEDPAVTFEPLQFTVVGDPAIAIDEHGTTHVSGIATHSQVRGYNVFYLQSPDLGQTWSEPVILTDDDDNDRNWMDIGPDGTLYVAWQNVGDSVQVAWSADGGVTWQVTDAYDDCITVSRVLDWQGRALLACSGVGARSVQDVQVLELTAGTLVHLATIDQECVWPKLSSLGGRLVLTAMYCGSDRHTMWAHSLDAKDWDVQDMEAVTGAAALRVLWQETDGWHRLHFVLHTSKGVEHMAVDADGRVQSRIVLVPARTMEEELQRPPESLGPDYGDHYYGLAFAHGRGLVAWTDHRGIDVALVEPVWA